MHGQNHIKFLGYCKLEKLWCVYTSQPFVSNLNHKTTQLITPHYTAYDYRK